MPTTQLKTARSDRPASRSPASASVPGRSAAAAGSSAGGRRRTTSPSPRSTARSSKGSTGSTPRPPTGSVTPSRSSAARWRASRSAPTCSPRARCSRDPAAGSCTASGATRCCARPRRACSGSESMRSTSTRSTGPIPAADIEEGWAALAELKDRGLVRHIGVSNFDVEQLRRIQQIAPVETLQPPYSLVDRAVEDEILPFAEREGIGVIVYSPMGSGLLTGAMTRERIAALPGRRLAQARRALPGARTLAPPGDRRAPGDRRRAPRHHAGRGRDRLDARQPGGRRRDRRLPPPGAGRPRSAAAADLELDRRGHRPDRRECAR